jgi:hypothetical protein
MLTMAGLTATVAWLLVVPPSGCLPGGCGGWCATNPSFEPACDIPPYSYDDAGACPVDGGQCVVTGSCACVPGRSDCNYYGCVYSKTQSECVAVGTCQWSLVCAYAVDCGQYDQDTCNSHPECYYQVNQGC